MSRGSVVSAGQISGNSFSVLMTDQMAPNARIVVYYVRANGEIVTDSISFDVDGAFKNKVWCWMFNHLYSYAFSYKLTHLSRMEFPILTNWTSLFSFQGLFGCKFHFYSNLNRTFCKVTVQTLIRRHSLGHLVWVCTFCMCPTKRTLGLYG